jgi:hypothetical protein
MSPGLRPSGSKIWRNMQKIRNRDDLTSNNSKYLYHYTTTRNAIEGIFPSNSIKFNSLCNMNDPFEFLDFNFLFKDRPNVIDSEASRIINDILKRRVKVCCFSENRDKEINMFRNGFFRARMWSQYADRHKGLCLVFNRDNFIKNIMENPKSIDVPIGADIHYISKSISYTNDLFDIFEILILNVDKPNEDYAFEYVEKYIDRLLFRKLEDYRDESEYRVAIYSKNHSFKDEIFISWENSLEAIILGTSFCYEYYRNIEHASKIYDVPVFSIDLNNGAPIIRQLGQYK